MNLLKMSLKRLRSREISSTIMVRAPPSSIVFITFLEKNKPSMSNPYNDVMVVTTLIVNYQVGRILIDTRSLVNIIYKLVFDKLGLANSKLCPIRGMLYGFSWE